MLVLRAVFIACIFLLVFLSGFWIAFYDGGYYQEQFEQQGVYERFGKEKIDGVYHELIGYLRGRGELRTSFFNDREKQHLADVRAMVGGVLDGFYFVLFLFLALLAGFLMRKQQGFLSRAFFWGGMCGLAVVVVLVFMTLIDFNGLFTMFHVLGFRNDLWLLPADSNLIQMFPLPFFYGMFSRILGYAAGFSLLMVAVGKLFLFQKKRAFNKTSEKINVLKEKRKGLCPKEKSF